MSNLEKVKTGWQTTPVHKNSFTFCTFVEEIMHTGMHVYGYYIPKLWWLEIIECAESLFLILNITTIPFTQDAKVGVFRTLEGIKLDNWPTIENKNLIFAISGVDWLNFVHMYSDFSATS